LIDKDAVFEDLLGLEKSLDCFLGTVVDNGLM
jgi:hypothetical protein